MHELNSNGNAELLTNNTKFNTRTRMTRLLWLHLVAYNQPVISVSLMTMQYSIQQTYKCYDSTAMPKK